MLTLSPFHNFFTPLQKLLHHNSPPPTTPSAPSSSPKMTTLLDLNDDILQIIFENILNAVFVSNNRRISESAITDAIPLASTCTRLMSIFSRSLTDLELWTTANITDAGLVFLCTRGRSHIKRLILRGCYRLHASLPYISHCQRIKTLDLSCVDSVDDAILSRICHGIGSTVQSLLLRRCIRLTDEGIRRVAKTCVVLRALDLGGLLSITDAAVEHIVRFRSATLQILILSWCERLTDRSLHMLAATSLQAVFLRGLCITDSGIAMMIQGIANDIVALDVLDCPSITNGIFSGCLQTCPSLRAQLRRAAERSIFENCVSLLASYVYTVGGVNQFGQESTVVCILDAGSVNSFAFHVRSGEAMSFDSEDVRVIATNSGVALTRNTREMLNRNFGIEI